MDNNLTTVFWITGIFFTYGLYKPKCENFKFKLVELTCVCLACVFLWPFILGAELSRNY